MYIKAKTGNIIWQVKIVCCDRVIYQSTTTKSIRVLKKLKHGAKTFIDVSNQLTQNEVEIYPF